MSSPPSSSLSQWYRLEAENSLLVIQPTFSTLLSSPREAAQVPDDWCSFNRNHQSSGDGPPSDLGLRFYWCVPITRQAQLKYGFLQLAVHGDEVTGPWTVELEFGPGSDFKTR
ncbi:hypothetical protein STEG23_010702 [Scotinomys teguina]